MWRYILLLGTVALMLTASSQAQPRERMRDRGHDRSDMIVDRLDLNDSQKAEMKKLRLDHEKEQARLQSDIRIARIELRGLMSAEKLDRTAIEKQTQTVHELQGRTQMNRIDHMFAVEQILNAEQKEIWREHLSRRGDDKQCPHCGGIGHRQKMRGKW